jgi:PAS domain S-box-containing protein
VRLAGGDDSRAPVPVSGPAEVQALAVEVNALTTSVHRELDARHRAEQTYRLLFESSPIPTWLYDAETQRFLAVNDAAIAGYGYSRAEFLAMTISEIRPAGEVQRLQELLDDPERNQGLRIAGTWRHSRKDGTELDAEISSHDHLFEGRATRIVIALDVTERLRAEQALRISEARYRDLFENASDLITAVDLDGRLTAVNEAFVLATGYTREELVGMPISDLVPAEQRAAIVSARSQKLDGAESTVYDSELVARDGRRIQLEVSSRLIFEHGQPVGTEAICRDISERLQLEEQLRQAQRLEAVGRLAGGVAHDFNNLLTVISGYTETLLADRDRGDEFELGQVAAAAERATILTRQLLAFSRRQVLQPRVIVLNEVIEGITPMLSRLIGEDLELVASLDPELKHVLADPNQLEQVLLNLAVNARDAMPAGGALTIRTANVELDEVYVAQHGDSVAGAHVMLSVSDTGTGMDADTLSRLFEPFFTTKAVGTGTGLGLATVHGIVKQSGGSIWVYSEPGQGTTFKVYLPVTETAASLEVSLARSPATGSETILLAEDEESVRTLTATLLERSGYVVIAAASADEALRIAEEDSRRIDLLLTDLIMPGLSGSVVAERVSELVPGVKVLFMSGYTDDVVVRNGNLAPGAAFLEKPFSAADLAAKVRETLDMAV